MSLTYSLNQPRQNLSRVAVITFIAILHIGAFIAFNNGIGHFFKNSPLPDLKVIEVPVDPPVENRLPVPEVPKSVPEPAITPPIVEPIDKVIDVPPPITQISESSPSDATDATSAPNIPTVSKLTVTYRTDPVYPSSAQAAGEQGVVQLDAQVDPYGNVVNISVIQSSGFAELDAAAIQAVKRWHFAPISTGAHVRVPIRFQLNTQKH